MKTSRNADTSYGQCRCCLVTGHHKDIMKTYHRFAKKEVYFDMFLDCFNLFLSTHSGLTTLICKACIQKLHDAIQFKTMVIETEKSLLAAARSQETLFVRVPGPRTEDIKIESDPQFLLDLEPVFEVKSEPGDPAEQEEELELDDDQGDPDWHDEFMEREVDEESSEPLPAPDGASMVAGEAALLARFARGSLRLLPTRHTLYKYDAKFDRCLDRLRDKVVLASSIEDLLKEKPSRSVYHTKRFAPEKEAQVANTALVLENSNATPFRNKTRAGFQCYYCRNGFENLEKMQEHQQKEHKKSEIKSLLNTYGSEAFVIYVDITDLKCTICKENVKTIPELRTHLAGKHKLQYYHVDTDRMIPFKLSEDNIFECQVCRFSFETFGSIERHMNSHFRNFVCQECGSGYVTKYRLKVHMAGQHSKGHFPCQSCKKVFSSHQKLKNHVDFVHKLRKRFKCPKCPERFTEYFQRMKHLVSTHGVAPLHYKCRVCDKAFDRRYELSRHMRRDHLEQRDFQCEVCAYTCFTKNELRVHMIKHNGERIHECPECKKAYARKKTLKEHMRIHQNDRRFVCGVCGQAFIQKCSLKGHMKTHHAEYST